MVKRLGLLRTLTVIMVVSGLFLTMPQTALAAGEGPGGVDNATNLILWLKADAGVTLNGTTVSAWNDQSNPRYNVTQATPANQPIYQAGALNGRPVLRFDGINDRLVSTEANAFAFRTGDLSWFIVAKPNDNTTRKTVFGTLNNTNYNPSTRGIAGGFSGAEYPYAWYRENEVVQQTSALNQWVIFGTRRVSGTAYLYRNSVQVGSGSASGDIVNAGALCVGCAGVNQFADFFTGDVAEIIVFNKAVSTAERILIENYLSAKYGIPLAANDIYAGDTYGFTMDVVGIGRTADGMNTTAQSAGMHITNQGFLQDNGDYIVIGHQVLTNATTTNDCPTGVDYRWTRVWALTKTDVGTQGGTVEIVFDFSESGLGGMPTGGYTLLKRESGSTGPFSGIAVSSQSNPSRDQIVFNVNANLLGSDFTLGHNNPTAVTLASFEAVAQAEGVLVTWETASELDNVGFNLYRAETADGPYTKLNDTLVPPQMPGSVMGAVYTWLDEAADPLVPHYYKLEDIDIKGISTFHGPVSTEVFAAPTALNLVGLRGNGSLLLLTFVALGLIVALRRR